MLQKMTFSQVYKITLTNIILFYLFENNSATLIVENSTFLYIPDLIKENILKPFYQTSNCLYFLNDSNYFNHQEQIKEMMKLTSLVFLNDNCETWLKECSNILLFVENPNILCIDKCFKKEKRNILIISYGLMSSNIDFINTKSASFGISNVLFVFISSGDIFHLNAPFELHRKFVKTTLQLIKNWTKSEKKLPNLQGRNVTAATAHLPLYSIVDPVRGKENIQGIEMLMVKELAKQLNFTISIFLIEEKNKWGTVLKNGTWVNGIMGAMTEGFAELAFCSLFINYKMGLVLDYTPPWSKLYITYLVPRPSKLDDQWQSIFFSFQTKLWLGVISSLVLVSSLHWLMTLMKFNIGVNQRILSFQSSTFGILGALTIGSHIPCDTHNRYLITSWYVFALIITTAYSCRIVSRLMVPVYKDKIDTVKQLVESDLFWGKNYEVNYEQILNMENIWHRKLKNKFKVVNYEELSYLIKSKQFAVITNRLNNDYFFTELSNISDSDLSHLQDMTENTMGYPISISFRKHSPLFPSCSRIIRRLIEAGIVQYLIQDVIRQHGRKSVINIILERNLNPYYEPVKLNISHLRGAFYLLLFGLCIAAAMFIVECIKFRLHSLKQNSLN